jgi:predicted peptidase
MMDVDRHFIFRMLGHVWPLSIALTFSAGSLPAAADSSESGFVNKEITYKDGTTGKYVLFVPKTLDVSKKAPTILFLHGMGERGTDNVKQTKVGLPPAIEKRASNFPFITIIPQAARTWSAMKPDAEHAMEILEQVKEAYPVDERRIYLTGLSMGAFGTWGLAMRYPDKFAAIAPVCGAGKPDQVDRIKHVPVWCFHGDADKAVPVAGSREMVDALKKAGANPKYTEYPGVGHNSWDQAYGTEALYAWFLEHELKSGN